MTTLFISDLHLCAQRPAITELFLTFLRGRAPQAEALYILGDLMEYWIGDEAMALPEHQAIIHGLTQLTASGVPVYLMHGNRDFLMGQEFMRATGCQLLHDPCIIDLYQQRVLLMHGDSLCTDDVDYIAFRKMVRDPAWQQKVLAMSVPERIELSRQLRQDSQVAMADKKPEIMDVNQQTVEAVMREHGVTHLIHGHTHRPGEHQFQLDGQTVTRTVLGDWYEQGSVLSCQADGWVLESLIPTVGPA